MFILVPMSSLIAFFLPSTDVSTLASSGEVDATFFIGRINI
jgi:hypothetical protein